VNVWTRRALLKQMKGSHASGTVDPYRQQQFGDEEIARLVTG